MSPRTVSNLRAFLHVFLGIAFFILVTGGGRIGKIDFISLDAWVAVALLPALALFYAREPLFYRWGYSLRDRIASRPLLFAALVFITLAAAHLAKYLTLHVNLFDAGYVYQSIFQAFGTPFLKCDVCPGGTYLGAHSAFTFVFLSPLANLTGTPLGIPILQSLLGFTCFALIAYSFRKELDRRLIGFVFFFMLTSRGIREGFIFDFREDLLGSFFYVLAFLSLKKGRPFLALLPFALAALSKETAAILLPFAAISGLYIHGKPRPYLLALYTVFSLGLFAFVFLGVLPHFTPEAGAGSDLARRLSYLGATPSEILLNLGRHPLESGVAIFSHLATWERLRYLLIVAGPFTLIAWRAFNPYYIPALVLLFGNLLSEAATQRMMQFHYELLLIPFLGFGVCESIRKLKEKPCRKDFFEVILLIALAVSGTWPLSHIKEYLRNENRIGDAVWTLARVAEIEPSLTILGDPQTIPFLVHRKSIRVTSGGMGPLPASDARYAFLLKEGEGQALGDSWRKNGCGPKEIICLYEKIK